MHISEDTTKIAEKPLELKNLDPIYWSISLWNHFCKIPKDLLERYEARSDCQFMLQKLQNLLDFEKYVFQKIGLIYVYLCILEGLIILLL